MFDNGINLVGNLTADPDLKITTGGVAVVRLRLACSRRIFDRTANEWRDGDPAYFSVTAWRQLAQNIHTSLRKGDRVVVVGRMRQSAYEVNNEKRTRWEVEADAVGAELSWSYAQVQRSRRPAADAQETHDGQETGDAGTPGHRADGFVGGSGQHSGAEMGHGLDGDLSYLAHEDVAEGDLAADFAEPATV